MSASGSISTLLLRPLLAALGNSPQALEAFYGATDLTSQLVADNDARVSPAQFCVAWSELIRLCGQPTIALQMADAIPTGAFGIIEYVCRSAATLGEALHQWVRYLNLLDDAVRVDLVTENEIASLRVVEESEAPAPASHELCFALVVRQAAQCVDKPLRIASVSFAHPCTSNPDLYASWFGAPVQFGARTTELRFPKRALDLRMVSADPTLLAILTRAADEQARTRSQDPPMTAQIKRALRGSLQNDHGDIDSIARQLGMTPRSLQRRLKDERTTFQAVRDQARHELASRYLENGLSITEVSFLLGFSEPSAFFRAFKRWTGLTPQESRLQRRPVAHP